MEQRNIIVVAIAAFLLGFGVASLLNDEELSESPADDGRISLEDIADDASPSFLDDDAPANTTPARAPAVPGTVAGYAVSAPNQRAGDVVAVERAALVSPGWVAVREDSNGEPGNVLGAKWLSAGEHVSVEVKLLRSTVGGERYYAVMYTDELDDHLFDLAVDMPVADASGSAVMAVFETVASAGAF